MSSFEIQKEMLQYAAKKMADLLKKAETVQGLSETVLGEWGKICALVSSQISQDIVRVAVVGSIKSGKSTFINAFLKGDYLKRGAGVVTSFVTRIRKGTGLKATLYFKSWDEINSDIEHAMVMLPSNSRSSETTGFDLRQDACRKNLQEALRSLSPDSLISNGVRNESSVLMSSYLKGFESVKDIISSNTAVRYYEDDRFSLHRNFVGDDCLSVYLKDIEIEINSDILDSALELADCQGSDSPNPLHLAMIQDYLLTTHLIIYVISSRTGIRRADIRFLSMLKKMGLSGHILFVVNCDFSEHESTEELASLLERVKDEISLVKPDPEVYTISSLYNLFTEIKTGLSEKDLMRFLHWQEEKTFSELSCKETKRFFTDFNEKLSSERYNLLLGNPVERLYVISTSLDHLLAINMDILNRDSESAGEMLEKIKQHQTQILQLKTMMKSTLDGALQKIRKELKSDVDSFFDVRYGNIISGVQRFISQYEIDRDFFQKKSQESGFTETLYLVFHEFKHELDSFITEFITPEVIRFINDEEKKIQDYLFSVASPYDNLLQDALSDYNKSMISIGFTPVQTGMEPIRIPKMDAIRFQAGVKLPLAAVTLNYSAKIKTEAIMKLGCYSFVTLVRRLFKKPVQDKSEDVANALKGGVERMKIETERSVVSHFKDYRENIKFQYLLKLTEEAFKSLFQCLLDRFLVYSSDITQIVNRADSHQSDKFLVSRTLSDMREQSRHIAGQLKNIRD